jgi:hypothetical protein
MITFYLETVVTRVSQIAAAILAALVLIVAVTKELDFGTFNPSIPYVLEVVDRNWMPLALMLAVVFAWNSSRKLNQVRHRTEQTEVICFALLSYFNIWPETSMVHTARTESYQDRHPYLTLERFAAAGWIASLFNADNPFDPPHSAIAIRNESRVVFSSDLTELLTKLGHLSSSENDQAARASTREYDEENL